MSHKLLKKDQRDLIEKKVNEILVDHVEFNQWEILQKTAAKEGVTIEVADLKDISGVLFKNQDETWKILLNKEDSTTRNLFTLAHELGHYFLHRNEHSKFVDSQFGSICFNRMETTKYQDVEMEANEFAGILIMPQSILDNRIETLKKDLNKIEIDSTFISILAKQFGVSSVAMLTRLKNLDYVS